MKFPNCMGRIAALLVLGLALPGLAEATLQRIEDAYELGLNEVRLPGQPAGNLIVRTCAKCPTVTLHATEKTTWHLGIGTAPVAQAEFLKRSRATTTLSGALVYVYYQPGTGLVNRVVLDADGSHKAPTRAPAPGTKPASKTPAGARP